MTVHHGMSLAMTGMADRRVMSRVLACGVVLLGLVALGGWVCDVAALRAVIPGAVEMKVNTAFSLLSDGLILCIVIGDYTERAIHAALGLALVIVVLTVATLGEYAFGWSLRIDNIVIEDHAMAYNAFPGRMSPLTAIALFGVNVALLSMSQPTLRRIVVTCAGTTILIGAICLLGYAWNATEIVTDDWVPPVALNTAIGLVCLGAAIVLSRPSAVAPMDLIVPGLAKVEVKALTGFLLAVTLMIVSGRITYTANVAYVDAADWSLHSQQVRATLADLNGSLAMAELALRDYLLAADPSRREDYRRLIALAGRRLDALTSLTAANSKQQQNLGKLRPVVAKRLQALATTLTAYEAFGLAAARAISRTRLGSSTAITQEWRARTEAMDSEEQRLLTDRQRAATIHRETTFISMAITVTLGFSTLIWLFFGIRREMRIRLQLEEELHDHAQRLEESNRELESFGYTVSHDLRAPLRVIAGLASIIVQDQSTRLDADGSRHVTAIVDNVHRMEVLIDDLLAFSRLGRQGLVKRPVDMHALVHEVMAHAISECKNSPPAIEIDSLPAAFADRALLRQVWINLISNAMKYGRAAAPPLISISGCRRGTEVIYQVKDNGVGFDMAYADKLFNVFQRLHRADEFEGTGLGLAIVQRIVARHGGRIWAQSSVGQGATFTFALPHTG